MDHKKSQVGSSSSLTSQLFGSQDSSSSSHDVLASIFPPKGRGQNGPSGNQPWNNKQGLQDNPYIHRDAAYGSSVTKERNSTYHGQEGGEPCHLSSSLYYGSRDMYSKSHTSHSSTSYSPHFKKDGGEDDPNGASRGNWWQGSLYY